VNRLYRMLDVNLNRVSEGARVLEDMARLRFDHAELASRLRSFRHAVRDGLKGLSSRCLAARDADRDVGLSVSRADGAIRRSGLLDLAAANFKRVQEGMRAVEETLDTIGRHDLSREYERLRFQSYTLEKLLAPLLARERRRGALDTDLYGLTAEAHSLGRSNVQVVSEMLAAGVKIIQYRDKDKPARSRRSECLSIREITREAGATFIVNDHPDLALMVEADGVHLGQDDYPPEAVRNLVGDDMLIGVSTHSPSQAEEAIRQGADYIGVGPLFRTFTKRDVCEPVGLGYLDYAVANVSIPFVAIGGLKLTNVAEARRRGARCVALVTEIVGAPDIRERIARIRVALQEGEEPDHGLSDATTGCPGGQDHPTTGGRGCQGERP